MLKPLNAFALSMKSGLDEAASLMNLSPKQARFRVWCSTIVLIAAAACTALAH